MFRLRRTDRDVSTWHPGINVLLRETPPYINRDHLPLNEEVEPMMRGCAWTIGVIVVVVVALGILGSFAPEEPRRPSLDLTKPVYLAKDAVECDVLAAAFTYSRGQQAGGESEGHRAVANLFVHPTEDCYRVTKRERVRVLDATTGDRPYVKTKCILSLFGTGGDC